MHPPCCWLVLRTGCRLAAWLACPLPLLLCPSLDPFRPFLLFALLQLSVLRLQLACPLAGCEQRILALWLMPPRLLLARLLRLLPPRLLMLVLRGLARVLLLWWCLLPKLRLWLRELLAKLLCLLPPRLLTLLSCVAGVLLLQRCLLLPRLQLRLRLQRWSPCQLLPPLLLLLLLFMQGLEQRLLD